MNIRSFLYIAIVLSVSTGVHAGAITISSSDSGWYNETGSHTPSNQNIYTGTDNSFEYRHFLQFDLSFASGLTITGATLTYRADNGELFTYDSTETLTLFNISSDISNLLGGTGGVTAFEDLGTGDSYGSIIVDTSEIIAPMPEVAVLLNSTALTEINSKLVAGDYNLLIGGALSSISDAYIFEGLWAGSASTPSSPVAQLTLSYSDIPGVPIPAAVWLFGSGIVGLIGVARRKKS
jgi:hypothetical protein